MMQYTEPADVTIRRNVVRLTDEWCKRTGKSLCCFCRLAGISQSAFWYYRSGERKPSLKVITKMASTLGVPVEVLFRR